MEKVKSGDPVNFKASTWNAFIDAANYVKNVQQNQESGRIALGLNTGTILVKNTTNNQLNQFTALVPTKIAVLPKDNEEEFCSCKPVLLCDDNVGDDKNKPFVVIQEPIAANEIGRASILGITPAKINVKDESDTHVIATSNVLEGGLETAKSGPGTIIWKEEGQGEHWAIILLGGGAGAEDVHSDEIVICKVKSGSVDVGFKVDLYSPTRAESVGNSIGEGTLFPVELAVGSELPKESWIIGHSVFVKETIGSE